MYVYLLAKVRCGSSRIGRWDWPRGYRKTTPIALPSTSPREMPAVDSAEASKKESISLVQRFDVNLAPGFLLHPYPEGKVLPLQSSDDVEGRDLFVVDYPVNVKVREPVVVSRLFSVASRRESILLLLHGRGELESLLRVDLGHA